MVHDSADEQKIGRRMETARRMRGGYPVVVVLAGILLIYLVCPVIYFFFFYSWSQTGAALSDPVAQEALITSVLSATVTSGITALLGIPLGYVLARRRFPGRQTLILLVYLPLVFPPVVSGILLLVLYGPYGLVGGPFTSAGLGLLLFALPVSIGGGGLALWFEERSTRRRQHVAR